MTDFGWFVTMLSEPRNEGGGLAMKKGELRRDSILRTAEKLFFEKGYD